LIDNGDVNADDDHAEATSHVIRVAATMDDILMLCSSTAEVLFRFVIDFHFFRIVVYQPAKINL
jgi:hypothetical protein